MGNKFQLFLFSFSNCFLPLVVFLVFRIHKMGCDGITLIALIIAILSIIGLVISFKYAKRNLEVIQIQAVSISKIEPNFINYCSQLCGIFFLYLQYIYANTITDAFWLAVNIIIPLIAGAVGRKTNFILLLIGYKFYNCTTVSGIAGYILISKRSFRNVTSLKMARRYFENIILDVGDENV